MARRTTGMGMLRLVGLLALGTLAPTLGCGMLGMEMTGHGMVRIQGERKGMQSGGMQGEMGGMQGGMMGRGATLERLVQPLDLTDAQRTQVQALWRTYRESTGRLEADIEVMSLDVRALLEEDPVPVLKVQELVQALAAKHADLYLAHITLMQDVRKLLSPEQQKTFRPMQGHILGNHGMMGCGAWNR